MNRACRLAPFLVRSFFEIETDTYVIIYPADFSRGANGTEAAGASQRILSPCLALPINRRHHHAHQEEEKKEALPGQHTRTPSGCLSVAENTPPPGCRHTPPGYSPHKRAQPSCSVGDHSLQVKIVRHLRSSPLPQP